MPGQRGTERRKLGGRSAYIRMSPELAGRVEAAAIAAGLTTAAWLRARAGEAVGVVDSLPTTRRREPPTAAVLEVARLREVVAELSGALVRVAVRTREGRLDELHAVVEAVLPDVKRAVRDIDAVKKALMS